MLNKAICVHCINKRHMPDGQGWDRFDEKAWESHGMIMCPCGKTRKNAKGAWYGIEIEGLPPKGCPYITEHTVSQKCP